jgi:hypothetical protein
MTGCCGTGRAWKVSLPEIVISDPTTALVAEAVAVSAVDESRGVGLDNDDTIDTGVGARVGFDTCPGVTCDAAPTTLTAPPAEIRMRSIINNDSICLLIEIHHHVVGLSVY